MKPFASLSKRSVDPELPGFNGRLSGRPGSVRRSFVLAFNSLLLTLLLVLCLSGVSFAQTQVAEEWVKRFGTLSHTDEAKAIAVDAQGNSYVTGTGWDGEHGRQAITTVKYDTYGNKLWEAFYSGSFLPGDNCGNAIVIDPSGNIFVTGYITTTHEQNQDLVVLKYDPNGFLAQWYQYDNSGWQDKGVALALDAQGDVYVTGLTNMNESAYYDYAWVTLKLNGSDLSLLWDDPVIKNHHQWDGTHNDQESPVGIAVDEWGHVYVAGTAIEFPKPGEPHWYHWNYLTVQYRSSDGGQNWEKMYDWFPSGEDYYQDYPKALTVDGVGNVIVTGQSQPFLPPSIGSMIATIKYDPSGATDCSTRYHYLNISYDDRGNDVVTDASNNIYITGEINTFTNPARLRDCVIIKYYPSLYEDPFWVRSPNSGSIWDDEGVAMDLDGFGGVYVTGYSSNGGADIDYYTLKYTSDGDSVWAIRYDGPLAQDREIPVGIGLDLAGNVYVAGSTNGDDPSFDFTTVKYNQREQGGGFTGAETEPSQGRHLVRDSWTGDLHLVMHRVSDDAILYTKSTDGGYSWVGLSVIGTGKYPTICLVPSLMMWTMVCVAYRPIGDDYHLTYRWFDPGLGDWQEGQISVPPETYDPGPPSMVTDGYNVYVAYRIRDMELPNTYNNCSVFPFFSPASATNELVDATGNPEQPCLAYDAEGNLHAAWRRTTGAYADEIFYSKRENGVWWTPERVYWSPGYLSTLPFVECFGESVFVVWSEQVSGSPSDAFRAGKRLWQTTWPNVRNFRPSSQASESPVQSWREFTVWSEGENLAQPDLWYWSQKYDADKVEANNTEWSYWPHSQMTSNDIIEQTDLWVAWTESPNPNQTPYRVLTKHRNFWWFGGGQGLGGAELSDYGCYYKVLAGQDSASRYCRKRDGVLRFSERAVDFARDSLVFELPYLDPNYDYFVRVASYRETGNDWVQALSMEGSPARSVRFAPNQVDTAWVQIPPEAYIRDRKVRFALRNVRGDYVTSSGLTLFQRDPKSRRKGGPQAGEPVSGPAKEVFSVYPNPARGQAQVEFSLKAPGEVKLAVYDVMGRLVRNMVSGRLPAGVHKAVWDGKTETNKATASGVYFVRLTTPQAVKTTRLVVVR